MAIKSKSVKRTARDRRKLKIRKRVTGHTDRPRLTVFKSNIHTYAQLISDENGRTLAAASTLEKEVVDMVKTIDREGLHNDSASTKSVAAAKAVGMVLAKRGIAHGISKAVFDRNGFLFHGRIKAVADGARSGGLDF